MDNMDAVIEMNNIYKSFKGFQLEIPQLQIPKGFATALIGENGAGKSTLLRILAGVCLDYKGELRYYDGSMKEEEIRERIGYMGPIGCFMKHWTLQAISEMSEILFDGFQKERFWQFCNELGIDKEKGSYGKFSDGMKMKAMLSAVFARDTAMLLLDEPASPLDPLMRDKLCSMIRNYIDEGDGERSVFFSTHNVSDMENVTDYIIILEQGNIVEQGFVEDLKEKYVVVKGENEDAEQAKKILWGFQKNAYGFEGLCLASDLDKLAGLDIAMEVPSLSQISVAVMKKYSVLHM